MHAYRQIELKLQAFIRKYYLNELIKGSILFVAFGLLYFLFTLFVEDLFWLKPIARTFLFWAFILVEFFLLYRYIFIPIFKIMGISKGISQDEASRIIGKHFTEVDDKLLNMLQLHGSPQETELLLAGIEQKAESLSPVPFQKAVRFSTNKKYLKYLFIPLLILLFTFFSGHLPNLEKSYVRVVNHQKEYMPPAPFAFEILNNKLEVIEGESMKLDILVEGDVLPEEAKIYIEDQAYFLNSKANGQFSYRLDHLTKDVEFFLQANNVTSQKFNIRVIPTPNIQEISLQLNYPRYLNKKNEKISNTGNVIVPTGTQIQWRVKTKQTDALSWSDEQDTYDFSKKDQDFSFSKSITKNTAYQLAASNRELKDYEKLSFNIEVIPDEYPKMNINTDIDSLSSGEAQFIGRLSDDYALTKLQLVYYPIQNPEAKTFYTLDIPQTNLTDFYYIYPQNIELENGIDYEFYFEVFDNDRVSGPKSVKSKKYTYHKNTDVEAQEEALEEQKQNLEDLKKTLERETQNRESLENIKEELQNKPELEFNDTKKLEQFIKRQEEYQKMMERQTDELQRNIQEQPETKNQSLEEKKEALKARIQETKDMAKKDKLLEEIEKMLEKMDKEELLDKMKKMSTNNQQKEKSLEQLLELTKRFYVEQKMQQISDKLQELAKEQENLSESPENSKEKQEKLNEKFEDIQKEMDELMQENESLKEPMDIDEQKPEQQNIEQDQQEATDQLEQQNKSGASKKQKSAAKKMQQMAQMMQMNMAGMQMEGIEEDIALLRNIVENLLVFSFKQENLALKTNQYEKNHPEYAKNLKVQFRLKSYFEHIDDSLYVLSMRQVKLTKHINTYLANAHYYLDESLSNLGEFNTQKAHSDQRFVMTAANDLAVLLSNMLNNMMSSMSMGSGKGSQSMPFSLPDIIQQQQGAMEKAKQAMGKKEGDKEGDQQDGNQQEGENGQEGEKQGLSEGELYEIYKEQAKLRQALENQLDDLYKQGLQGQGDKVKKQMEELEMILLEKGITQETLERMQELEYELLKLENAARKQGMEQKRESKTNTDTYPRLSPKQLEFKNKYQNQDEILNREVLPLRPVYRKKVQEYFKQDEE